MAGMIGTTTGGMKARTSTRMMVATDTMAATTMTTAITRGGITLTILTPIGIPNTIASALGGLYPYGRYEHVRGDFIARGMDFRTRRVVLYDNSNWVVASYDLERCRDWEWDRDRVYVYDDDHHPGWYLLFNARLGRYVHVEYFGVH
jgi:hypothetical protein